MNKFSPAPWKWETEGISPDKERLLDANGNPVLSVVFGWEKTDYGIRTGKWTQEDSTNAIANGDLIELSPELYLKLQKALTWIKTLKRVGGIAEGGPLSADIQEMEELLARI